MKRNRLGPVLATLLILGVFAFLFAGSAQAALDRTDYAGGRYFTDSHNTVIFGIESTGIIDLVGGAVLDNATDEDRLAIAETYIDLAGIVGFTGAITITGNLSVDGTLIILDGSTSVRGISAGFVSLESPANRFGSDAAVYMSIATTATTGITAITHTGSAPVVTWTADGFDFAGPIALDAITAVGNLSVDGTTALVDGSTSTREVSAGFTSHESPANRMGLNATEYMQIATTVTTGITAITHTGSAPAVTWTADSLDLVAPLTLSSVSTIGLEISGANTTHAISISAAQVGSGLHIGDTWKLGMSDGAINIGGDATIAFGSVADSVIVKRVDVSAQMSVVDKYVMGTYQTLGTSGAGPGTSIQHGIWMGDYTKLTIAHDTTDAYATRGRTLISDTIEGNQFIGVMGQFEVTGAATLDATGGGYGVYGSITSSGSGTSNRNVAAGYFTMRPNTIDLAGDQYAVVADMGGSGYCDYGFGANVGNNNTAAAIRVQTTDSAVLPIGLLFTATSGSITREVQGQNGETLDNATDGFWNAQAPITSYAQSTVLNDRHRVTVAEINAGHELLPAITGRAYRIVSVTAIAYGGAVGTTTTVDILGTQAAGSVKLVAYAQASLTQSTVLNAGDAGAAVLADGASFAVCDAATAITISKTGGDADTATGIDVIITYVIE